VLVEPRRRLCHCNIAGRFNIFQKKKKKKKKTPPENKKGHNSKEERAVALAEIAMVLTLKKLVVAESRGRRERCSPGDKKV